MYRKGSEFKIWVGTFDLDKEVEYAIYSMANAHSLSDE